MVTVAARSNLVAHIEGERARDLDALMAPLANHPRYVIPGLVLEGQVAVRAMYQLALPRLTTELSDEYLRALDDPQVTRWGENHCVIEYDARYPLHRGMVVIVHFAGDRVRSENTYFTTHAGFQSGIPAAAFAGIPGVNRID
jgi:hypothetical protein